MTTFGAFRTILRYRNAPNNVMRQLKKKLMLENCVFSFIYGNREEST